VLGDKRIEKSRSPKTFRGRSFGPRFWPSVSGEAFPSARGLPKENLHSGRRFLRTCVLRFWAQREPCELISAPD
jgi:hypothetical protein